MLALSKIAIDLEGDGAKRLLAFRAADVSDVAYLFTLFQRLASSEIPLAILMNGLPAVRVMVPYAVECRVVPGVRSGKWFPKCGVRIYDTPQALITWTLSQGDWDDVAEKTKGVLYHGGPSHQFFRTFVADDCGVVVSGGE